MNDWESMRAGAIRSGPLVLNPQAAGHLKAAVQASNCLLETEQLEVAMESLLSMLKHLRALRLDTSS